MRVLVLLSLLFATALPAQVALRDLPELAKLRAERQRPRQEAALQPYWRDLSMDYRDNVQFVEQTIAKVTDLGDSVVPLLLEKLLPADGRPESRRLASNCRRVLEHFDPSTFVDALLELLAGNSATARGEALRLLGLAHTPRAVRALSDFLATAQGEEQQLVINALGRQKAVEVAPRLVVLLGSQDRHLREAVLDYLIAARPGAVADTVVQALSTETELGLLPLYVNYFAVAVRGNAAAATALLPLLDHVRLDGTETRYLVRALATVAPKDHEPTIRRLHEVIDNGEPGPLALQAATSLLQLGDKTGMEALHKAIAEQLKKKRKDPGLLELRGSLYFANEDWVKAADDYKEALDNSPGPVTTRRLQWQLVRCEAHRRRWTQMLAQLRDIAPTADEVLEAAKDDPALQDGLQRDRLRAWLQSLREQKPGGSK